MHGHESSRLWCGEFFGEGMLSHLQMLCTGLWSAANFQVKVHETNPEVPLSAESYTHSQQLSL